MHSPFLVLLAIAGAAQKPPEEAVIATATQDRTPRVGIVLSSFRGSKDHDGTVIRGLPDPQPVTARLTPAQVDAMVRKALEIGTTRKGGLAELVGPEDWVVVLAESSAPAEVIRSVIRYLLEQRRGLRFTVSGARILEGFAAAHPGIRFEALDLSADERIEARAPGRERAYRIAKTIQQCDRLISVASLGRTLDNYLAIADASPEALADLFNIRPVDYALGAASNLVVAGANAAAVDAVGAAILGRDPARPEFGIDAVESIWRRGSRVEEARKVIAAIE